MNKNIDKKRTNFLLHKFKNQTITIDENNELAYKLNGVIIEVIRTSKYKLQGNGCGNFVEFEDIKQDLLLFAISKIHNYNPMKCMHPYNYFYTAIRREFFHFANKYKRKAGIVNQKP
jgi:hypothetical protein